MTTASTSDYREDYEALEKLSAKEIGHLFPITIEDYNPHWAVSFEKKKSALVEMLGDAVLRVEHIGSTAIPGIQSKPIIDMLVEIPNDIDAREQIKEKMKSQGYYFTLRTDRTPPHMMFMMGYTKEGFSGEVFHIHMAERENQNLWDRLYFRDYLIGNEAVAKEYEALKLKLATEFTYNREAYTNGKDEFVKRITELAKAASK